MGREWYFGVYRYLCASKKSISIMMKALQNRTTIRRYKGDDVSEELLNGLLEQAARTQTMGNLQLYSVVQGRGEEEAGSGPFQPAHGHTGPRCADDLCRFQAHHFMGRTTKG